MTQHRSRASRLGLIAAPAVGLLVLAGCSSSGSDDNGGQEEATQEFSLTYATSNNIESPFEVLANAYMEANPDVTITLNPQPNDTYGDTLRTQLQAGNASDVLQTEAGSGQTRSIVPLAEAGFLAPLGDSASALIPEGSDALFQYEGDTYGLPLTISYSGLIFNETAAEAAGITEFAGDWDTLSEQCADASDAGKTLFVLAGSTVPNAGIMASIIAATRVYAEDPDWNQQRLDGDTSFADSEGWAATLQTIKDLNESGCFQAGAEGAGFDALTTGLTTGSGVSMFGPLGSASELAKAAPDQSFIAQAFPPATSSDQAFGVASPTYALSINAASENSEAATAFLEWIEAPENSGLFAESAGSLPISGLSDLDLSDTIYANVADLITEGNTTPLANTTWPNAAVYDALAIGVQGLLTGQSTVESVLASMDTAWDQ